MASQKEKCWQTQSWLFLSQCCARTNILTEYCYNFLRRKTCICSLHLFIFTFFLLQNHDIVKCPKIGRTSESKRKQRQSKRKQRQSKREQRWSKRKQRREREKSRGEVRESRGRVRENRAEREKKAGKYIKSMPLHFVHSIEKVS